MQSKEVAGLRRLLLTAMLGASMLVTSGVAHADPEGPARVNTLATDVAVRHRRLLVKNRFELTPLFESTVNADYRHIVGGGLKLEYHFSDILSFGIVGVASASINTGLVNKIVPTLEQNTDNTTREPSQTEFTDHLNSMPLHGAAYISITPWYGKLAAFGTSYVAFDFYFQAGVAFAQLSSDCPSDICSDKAPGQTTMSGTMTIPPDMNPNNDPPLNSGTRVGLYLGGGIHVYLNDFIGLDLTVRDSAFNDNPSGADFDANLFVDDKDSRFIHHLFMGVGLSIMFPMTVQRTQ
jgi:outer membrane beta-barrel protein